MSFDLKYFVVKLLGGGLRRGAITEICGASSSGRNKNNSTIHLL